MSNEGVKLKKLIKDSPYNQKEFAELVGVDPNYISMMIKGAKPITDSFLLNITKVMPDADISTISDNEIFKRNTGFIENDQLNESKEPFLIKEGVKFTMVDAARLIATHPEEAQDDLLIKKFMANVFLKIIKKSKDDHGLSLNKLLDNIEL